MFKLSFSFATAIYACLSTLSATTYQVVDIIKLNVQQLPTVNINNNGIVCGHTVDGPHQASLFVYNNNDIIFMKAFDSECTRLLSLNNNEVIGYYYEEDFSPIYGKSTQAVPFSWSMEKGFVSLKKTLGHIGGASVTINDHGWIAGHSFMDSIFDFYTHGGSFKTSHSSLIWRQEKGITILNHPSHPNNFGVCIKSMNNEGDAVGGIFYGSVQHAEVWNPAYAFLWDSIQKKIMPIGNLGGQDKFYSCATDINDKKQIVGLSEIDVKKIGHARNYYHVFLWDKGAMFDLGALNQNEDSIARAINSQGDIVGKSGNSNWTDSVNKAFIWTRKSGMVDLNSCIDANMNCKLYEALDINDDGWIVCLCKINGKLHIVLLIPED